VRPAVVCTPLRAERAALRPALPVTPVMRTGMGPARSTASAAALRRDGPVPVLVAGVGGGLAAELRPGDLVVASEVRGGAQPVPCPSAPLLAGALRRLGLPVHLGPVVTSPRLAGGVARRELAATGALAVDMESAYLAAAARYSAAVAGEPTGAATGYSAGARAGYATDAAAAYPVNAVVEGRTDPAAGGPFAVVRAIVDTPARPLPRPGTPRRGALALRALRRAGPAVEQWAAAVGAREVLLAAPRSFCAGVDRAIEIVERALQRYGAPVYVRRQIVHNAHVVADLRGRGAVFVEEVGEVPDGSVLVLAAHGVAPSVRAEADARGLAIIDATCPLVSKVHTEVRRYAARGDTVFLIGHREHEEVVGTVGEAPEHVVVVEDAEQAARVRPAEPDRVAYAMQTTLAVDEAEQVAAVLRERFPTLAGPRTDDICYATTNRQSAVREVARHCDLVLVVGSANSSNSVRLVEVAEREGAPAYLVDDASAVDLRWLAGVTRVGITAGASAPPQLVEQLVHCLGGLGPLAVQETQVTEESIRFTLPREVS
jgi:4-hydroxy-3-methylbut-2-en-1-yl diphosphate reductase